MKDSAKKDSGHEFDKGRTPSEEMSDEKTKIGNDQTGEKGDLRKKNLEEKRVQLDQPDKNFIKSMGEDKPHFSEPVAKKVCRNGVKNRQKQSGIDGGSGGDTTPGGSKKKEEIRKKSEEAFLSPTASSNIGYKSLENMGSKERPGAAKLGQAIGNPIEAERRVECGGLNFNPREAVEFVFPLLDDGLSPCSCLSKNSDWSQDDITHWSLGSETIKFVVISEVADGILLHSVDNGKVNCVTMGNLSELMNVITKNFVTNIRFIVKSWDWFYSMSSLFSCETQIHLCLQEECNLSSQDLQRNFFKFLENSPNVAEIEFCTDITEIKFHQELDEECKVNILIDFTKIPDKAFKPTSIFVAEMLKVIPENDNGMYIHIHECKWNEEQIRYFERMIERQEKNGKSKGANVSPMKTTRMGTDDGKSFQFNCYANTPIILYVYDDVNVD